MVKIHELSSFSWYASVVRSDKLGNTIVEEQYHEFVRNKHHAIYGPK